MRSFSSACSDGPRSLRCAEHGARRGHRQRVLAEGAAEVGGLGARVGSVAVLPEAAVNAVHEGRAAGNDADGQTAAGDLAVGGEVGCDAEPRLRPAGVDAETRHHFVEDQNDAGLARPRPQLMQEVARLQLRVAALHRLDEDGGEFVGVCAQEFERARAAVFEHQHVLGDARRDAGSERHREAVAALRAGERAVGVAVVGAGEDGDLRAARARAREPERRHHGLGAGVAEGGALHPRQLADERGDLAGERRARPHLDALPELFLDGLGDERRAVAEEVNAEAHRDVNVLVAVDVAQSRAGSTRADNRVEHLLDGEAEADDGAAVGEHRPILLRHPLRRCRAAREAFDQLAQVLPLPLSEPADRAGLNRVIRDVRSATFCFVRRGRCARRR